MTKKFKFQTGGATSTKRTTYTGEEADKVLGKPLGWSTKNPEKSKRLISNLMYQGKLATPAQQLEDASVEGKFEKSTVPIVVNGRVMGMKTLNTKEEAQNYYNAKQAEDSINSAVVDAMPGLSELKSGIEAGEEYFKSGNLDPLLVAGAIPFAGKAAKGVKAARALTRPITITAAAPVAKRIQQLHNLPVSSGKNVKGAYRFSEDTAYDGNFYPKDTTIKESSVETKIPFLKHMMQPDKVKKALRETGEESVLFQTNNPLFLRNSKSVEITGDAGEDLLIKGAKMYGGASQAKGEPVKAITNFGTSSKPSLGGLRQSLFGKPTNLSASLIYANKTGGTLKYQSDTMKKFTFKTGGLIGNSVPAIKLFKHGGIIAGGVLHSQKNKLGDKGIPVVPVNSYMESGGKYNKNDKLAEIESSELIFYKETADKIDKLVDEYIDCGCPDKLVQLGKVVHSALKSTTDETCRTQCEFKPKLNKIK